MNRVSRVSSWLEAGLGGSGVRAVTAASFGSDAGAGAGCGAAVADGARRAPPGTTSVGAAGVAGIASGVGSGPARYLGLVFPLAVWWLLKPEAKA